MFDRITKFSYLKASIAVSLIVTSFFLWGQYKTLDPILPSNKASSIAANEVEVNTIRQASNTIRLSATGHIPSTSTANTPSNAMIEVLRHHFKNEEKKVEQAYAQIQRIKREEHIQIVTDEYYRQLQKKVSRSGGGDISTYRSLSTYLQQRSHK